MRLRTCFIINNNVKAGIRNISPSPAHVKSFVGHRALIIYDTIGPKNESFLECYLPRWANGSGNLFILAYFSFPEVLTAQCTLCRHLRQP